MFGRRNRFRRVGLMAAALLLACSVALGALSYPFYSKTTDAVRLRKSPSASGTVLANLSSGTDVEVLGKEGNYYKVIANGTTGYIQKDYVSTDASVMTTPEVETVTGYPYDTVTKDSLNLRAQKNVKSDLLKQIPAGATVTVKAVSGTWAEVTYQGIDGYVKNEFLVLKKVVKATLPFYLCMLIALLLITFIPQISLWLPGLFGYAV